MALIDHQHDLARTHPGTYHLAVQTVREMNEFTRVGEGVTNKGNANNLQTFVEALHVSLSAGLSWNVVMEANVVKMNKQSNHTVWLAREVFYKYLNANASNKAEILADLIDLQVQLDTAYTAILP